MSAVGLYQADVEWIGAHRSDLLCYSLCTLTDKATACSA